MTSANARDPALGFRPLQHRDLPLIVEWLSAPHVARWWRDDADLTAIEAEYEPTIEGTDPTEVFIVEHHAEPVGLIQRYLLADNPAWLEAVAVAEIEEPAVGIDYLIGTAEHLGRGIGSRMIASFVAATWSRWPEVRSIVVSVQQENSPSWRALESAGFRRSWGGVVVSDHPSDNGPSFIYKLARDSSVVSGGTRSDS